MTIERAVEEHPEEETKSPTPAMSLRHDLRTPINQIIGYGEMLAEEAASEGHQQYVPDLEKIGIAARNLLATIDALPLDGLAASSAPARAKSEGPEVKSGEYVAPAGSADGAAAESAARILVVDDVELNRSMLSRRLERKGFQVETAEGGQEAIEKIRSTSYDLILLDIMMPEVSGYDVLKEVRKIHSPLELPIIMATAKDQGEDIVSAFKLGANDYITKPIDFPVALARIET
ncbi:MAG TPA: response regulator, partial [Vicinamibacteria bacterium]|nr:response regulator [Vicinamibacteria bacterium]